MVHEGSTLSSFDSLDTRKQDSSSPTSFIGGMELFESISIFLAFSSSLYYALSSNITYLHMINFLLIGSYNL